MWVGRIAGYNTTMAIGHGGQYVLLIPDLDLIVVTTAHPHRIWSQAEIQEQGVVQFIRYFIIPAVVDK